MCSRAQIYDRAAVLGQRVQVLVCQLAELQDLRDRVLRTEQTTVGTRRLSEGATWTVRHGASTDFAADSNLNGNRFFVCLGNLRKHGGRSALN